MGFKNGRVSPNPLAVLRYPSIHPQLLLHMPGTSLLNPSRTSHTLGISCWHSQDLPNLTPCVSLVQSLNWPENTELGCMQRGISGSSGSKWDTLVNDMRTTERKLRTRNLRTFTVQIEISRHSLFSTRKKCWGVFSLLRTFYWCSILCPFFLLLIFLSLAIQL
jgi:hypothetical protein